MTNTNIYQNNIDRMTTIIEKYKDKYSFYSHLCFEKTFPSSLEENPLKESIISFEEKFIGEFLHSIDKDDKYNILNFASAKYPGGGVLGGSIAQEEDICRNSLLYFSLNDYNETHYKTEKFSKGVFYRDFVIFSNHIPTINKEYEISGYNNYITCAAPNLNNVSLGADNMFETYNYIINKRMLGIFYEAAKRSSVKKLVLGPWGCGVFRNNPAFIAQKFKEMIQKYGGYFESIIFLVPDPSMKEVFTKTINF